MRRGFTFAFRDQHHRTIIAECASAAWKRHIRLRKQKQAHTVANDYQFAYEVQHSIAAEQPVNRNALKKVQKLRRQVAQNALKALPNEVFLPLATYVKANYWLLLISTPRNTSPWPTKPSLWVTPLLKIF